MDDYHLPFGLTRTPWGFKVCERNLLRSTVPESERRHHQELAETAIAVLERLGVSTTMLERLNEANTAGKDLLAELTVLQGAPDGITYI